MGVLQEQMMSVRQSCHGWYSLQGSKPAILTFAPVLQALAVTCVSTSANHTIEALTTNATMTACAQKVSSASYSPTSSWLSSWPSCLGIVVARQK